MEFGPFTRIVVQNQRAKAVEPKLKTMIIGAAQKAVTNLQHIIADGDYDEGAVVVTYDSPLAEAPVYVTVKGKGAGKKDATVLYESKKVSSNKTAYELQSEDIIRIYTAANVTVEPVFVPVTVGTDTVQVHRNALLTQVYGFYKGSPIKIANDSTDSTLTGIPSSARALMAGKNIVAVFLNAGTGLIDSRVFTDNGTGSWVLEGAALASSYVAIYEDQFNTMGTGVAHGTLYVDYVYNDYTVAGKASYASTSPLGKMYYIEDLDSIRRYFGNDALNLIPSGAAYNAHQYFLANGGKEGFYVYAVMPEAGHMYLDAETIAASLTETIRYRDAYDIIPITHDPDMPGYMHTHLTTLNDPNEAYVRNERRGYVGLYMPEGSTYYQYDEFEHLCNIGRDGERNYLIGATEEDPSPGTGRYGSRTAYVSAMMGRNAYTNNPKLTLCETKYGIIDNKYVTAATLMVIYVAFRRTFDPGYATVKTPLPLVSAVSFAGLLSGGDYLDSLQNYGVLSIYQSTYGSPATIYYPCTAATNEVQYMEEYLVTATDMFAREARAMLKRFTGNGEDNKIAPNFQGEKAQRYLRKLSTFIAPLTNKYVKKYGVFDAVEPVSYIINPSYEAGVMIAVRVKYLYQVNHLEVIIYI